jgi:adenine-specific DNA-methyltransferase
VSQGLSQKEVGAYYTPDSIVATLLRWAIRHRNDRLLDPACGDGRFIAGHPNSVGIEQDLQAAHIAMKRAQWARVYENDFFSWASETNDRFDCAAGNPPFIRYQVFKGSTREQALAFCERLGAKFSRLTSSWAPFLVATAGLLRPGGRMAFVVPAEIGHASYAGSLLEYLVAHFSTVHVVAIREKLFPELSEDCWLLHCEGFGGTTGEIRFTAIDRFKPSARPPRRYTPVQLAEWRNAWNRRLRPFLIKHSGRELYAEIAHHPDTRRFGELAQIGIGYVSGANEFFHLRPSEADYWDIPEEFLYPSVRNGRALPRSSLTDEVVNGWKKGDEPVLLLRLPKAEEFPASVHRYLDTDAGHGAREAYKCRMRDPWYSVPDVQIPDFFLSYMSGTTPVLVRNDAQCTCTNSVHTVRLKSKDAARSLSRWGSEFVQLSCELQGHPLGGGLLKLEPREASQIVLPAPEILSTSDHPLIKETLAQLRSWRHCGSPL